MPVVSGDSKGRAAGGARDRNTVWRRRVVEAVAVTAAAVALAVILTYPLAFSLDQGGRVDSGDGQFSIWNVAWVAHSLLERPDRLFDANIFHPHKNTLAFSEANLVAGAMAVPAYWLTGNPFVAHHSVSFAGFVLSLVGTWLLVVYLSRSRAAAAVAAITYAFCPFVFARTAHIQLLLIFCLPFVALAIHAFVDRLSLGTCLALAASLVVAALTCAYYGMFAALMAALGLAWFGLSRGLWRKARFWVLSSGAALLSMLAVYPFLRRYTMLGGGDAFRSLQENVRYSADGLAYLTAGGLGNRWMFETWGLGKEVLFPGFVALGLGLTGIILGAASLATRFRPPRAREDDSTAPRETAKRRICTFEVAGFYAVLGGLAFWLSFGPDAGLYTLFYHYVPAATLLRAPARIGIVVTLSLSVLGGLALAQVLQGRKRAAIVAALLASVAGVELAQIPLYFEEAPPRSKVYQALSAYPRGPVAEFPFFWLRQDYHRHCYYMLNSAWHWQSLVNGYSDYIPPDFREIVDPLSTFPSRDAFRVLAERHVLYVVFHLDFYDRRSKSRLLERIDTYAEYLRPLIRDGDVLLYEIVGYPSGRAED